MIEISRKDNVSFSDIAPSKFWRAGGGKLLDYFNNVSRMLKNPKKVYVDELIGFHSGI